MAGFFQNLGLAYGRSLQAGQEFQEKQADIDYKQSLAQQMRASVAQKQQEMQSQKEIGQFLQQQSASDAATWQDPLKSATAYDKASDLAIAHGDFKTAGLMSDLAKGKRADALEAQKAVTAQAHAANEDAATAAYDLEANPTQANLDALVQKATKAGVNPKDIPAPGTPAFQTWLKGMETRAMDSKSRAELIQKTDKANEDRLARIEAHKDNVALREQQMKQTAAYQNSSLELRKILVASTLERNKQSALDRENKGPNVKTFQGPEGEGQYQWDPSGKITSGTRDLEDKGWVKIGGEKLTAQQKSGISRAFASGSEIARQLHQINEFPADTRANPFGEIGAGNVSDALLKTGSNVLSPAQTRMLGVTMGGLGVEAGNLLSAMGGRTPNHSTQMELQAITTPQPGDDGYTVAYKLANTKHMLLTYLDNLPGNAANSKQAQKIRDQLKDIPDPEQVQAAAKRAGYKEKGKGWGTIRENTERLTSELLLPSAAPATAAAGTPGLPEGWSVKEH